MKYEKWVQQLMTLGLNKYEACAYLALLDYAESSAVEVADRAGVPRQRIYDVLAKLRDRGLIIVKQGRPMRYTAREQRVALRALLDARLLQHEIENNRLTQLVETIISEIEPPRIRETEFDGNGTRGGF